MELLQSSALPLGYVAANSGWRESNPRVDLGKVTGYHYITPAHSLGRRPRFFPPPVPSYNTATECEVATENAGRVTWIYAVPIWLLAPLAVICASSAAMLGLHATRKAIKRNQRTSHNDVAGAIFGIIGTVLAVGLSFMFINVWTQYVLASDTVQREASAVADLHHLADAFPAPTRAKVQDGLDEYMQLVIRQEWPLMRTGDHSQAAHDVAYRVLAVITSLKPASSEEIMIQSHALDAANAMLDERRQRLHANDDGIPQILWGALLFVACTVVLFSYYFRVENALEQQVMVAALAAVIITVMLLIAEFDYPFRGDVGVTPAAFQHAWNSLHHLQGGY